MSGMFADDFDSNYPNQIDDWPDPDVMVFPRSRHNTLAKIFDAIKNMQTYMGTASDADPDEETPPASHGSTHAMDGSDPVLLTSDQVTDLQDVIDAALAAFVSGTPETMNTLDELSAALGDDPNFATTVTNLIGTKLSQTLVDAKGDLLVGSADDTVIRLAVGTDGQVLTADAASAGGVKWAAAAASLIGLTDASNTAFGTGARASTTGTGNIAIGISAMAAATSTLGAIAIGYEAIGTGIATSTDQATVAIGYQALKALTSGGNNIGIGYQALASRTTQGSNVAIGSSAMATGNGGHSVAIGYLAAQQSSANQVVAIGSNTIQGALTSAAYGTVAIGYSVMGSLSSGAGNTAIGRTAGNAYTTASNNTVIGWNTAVANTGSSNSFLGSETATAATTLAQSVVIGHQAIGTGVATSGANGTIAIGYQALTALTTGAGNVAVGFQSAMAATTNANNTVMGYQAFKGALTGSGKNTVIGSQAMYNTTAAAAVDNVAIGYNSSQTLTGSRNAFVGSGSGANVVSIEDSVAVGYQAMGANTATGATTAANGTVAVGYQALLNLYTGAANIGIGYRAGRATTTANRNTIVGYAAALSNATGGNNVAIGSYAATSLNGGQFNTIAGDNAGSGIVGSNHNTYFGAGAGQAATGAGNIAIGSQALVGASSQNYSISIGYNSNATGAGSIAIGTDSGANGASTTVANEIKLGTANHTVNIPGGVIQAVSTVKTAAYAVTATDYTIRADATAGSFSVTLPSAVTRPGQVYVVKKTTADNVVTVATTSSQTIDGVTTLDLTGSGSSYMLQSDGANWIVL